MFRRLHHAPRYTTKRLVVFIAAICLAGGCAISEKQEMQIGLEAHPQFEQEFGGIYGDADVRQYVSAVGMEMARHAGRPNLNWEFNVLNSPQINAFAVPGGYCYITQGLLFRLTNEAQLAGVLGHEAAHIEHRHSVRQIQRSQAAGGVTAVVGIVASVFGYGAVGDVANVVGQLTLLKYGRDQETEADLSGLDYMTRAGYDPRGMVQTMQVLQSAAGAGGSPEWMSSHPNPGNRIEYLNETIARKYASLAGQGNLGEAEFRRHVLSRRLTRLPEIEAIDLSNAPVWCLTCRMEAGPQAPPHHERELPVDHD